MTITITITCDNEAFEGEKAGSELARILYHLGNDSRLRTFAELDGRRVRDMNGNTVGQVEVTL